MMRTGSKNIVANVWSEEARQAALEARKNHPAHVAVFGLRSHATEFHKKLAGAGKPKSRPAGFSVDVAGHSADEIKKAAEGLHHTKIYEAKTGKSIV